MEKQLNRCIIGLGSNYNKDVNIEKAISLLKSNFHPICFSPPILTPPIPENEHIADYLNCVAITWTAEDQAETITKLKEIEVALGRTSESKKKGIIPIDLDLLQWNKEVLKEEIKRYYVQEGLRTLNEQI